MNTSSINSLRTTTSTDGTTIAYEPYGSGPAVAIVGGAFNDRSASRDLARALAEHGFTGITYDRRGRGDSTNAQPYAVHREIEDLNAVLAAARTSATDAGEAAYAHGTSSGGALVIEALAAGTAITKASALEVPYRTTGAPPLPDYYVRTLEELEASGDREGILRLFHTRIVGMPAELLDTMTGTPMWNALLAMTPTLRHDALCLGGDDHSLPRQTLAKVTVPFLAICSRGTGMPWLHDAPAALAAALPNGAVLELEGGFHDVPAQVLAAALADFYRT
jgi:pimeloyl-ACP methyl ester carboxylesterase